ncbi:MAG: type II 3-dehydroquinate dehydratase [Francisellaceae bacterium]
MAKILIIHGPNLNLLGSREKDIYGTATLETIDQNLMQLAKEYKLEIECFQSNVEGFIVDKLHEQKELADFVIINPAAFTHTSVAIRDALLAIGKPFIETHLSNPVKRETFRQVSYISDVAYGIISGFGAKSYELAMHAAIDYCHNHCV